MSSTYVLFGRSMKYGDGTQSKPAKDSSGIEDMKQIDKLMAKKRKKLGITPEQNHPLPLPASAASGLRQGVSCQKV